MPKILILTTSHGASHRRASEALKTALLEVQPGSAVAVVDAIRQCASWFRAYYNSYVIPLRYWPSLWRWIESHQQQSSSTNPDWLYRFGGRHLFRYIEDFTPEVVVATEVGVCELVSVYKRDMNSKFFLVGLEIMDFNQGWVRPEVDLYPVVHEDLGDELVAAGAPRSKIITCGMLISPAYARLPTRGDARQRLALREDLPLLLVLFGGTGFGKPRLIVERLSRIQLPLQVVFVAGRNRTLETELRRLATSDKHRSVWRVLGWVDNMHEWMAASDLVLSKPGGSTVMEAAACALPLLAFDPLPGVEERNCMWIEKWQTGVWVRSAADIPSAVEHLFVNAEERSRLAEGARRVARPTGAHEAAKAIFQRASTYSISSKGADRTSGGPAQN